MLAVQMFLVHTIHLFYLRKLSLGALDFISSSCMTRVFSVPPKCGDVMNRAASVSFTNSKNPLESISYRQSL